MYRQHIITRISRKSFFIFFKNTERRLTIPELKETGLNERNRREENEEQNVILHTRFLRISNIGTLLNLALRTRQRPTNYYISNDSIAQMPCIYFLDTSR